MTIDKSLDLITSQHRVQPKFMGWLSGTLNIVNDAMIAVDSITSAFDIDTAVGVQQDVIGTIVGRSRVLDFDPTDGSSPVLSDDNYRLALKAKIAKNQWDGTLPKVYELWNSLFPSVGLFMVDNQDMTINALVDGELGEVAIELVVGGYIIPKPVGVKLNIIDLNEVSRSDYFGVTVSEIDFVTLTV